MQIAFKKKPLPPWSCRKGLKPKGSSLAQQQDLTGPASSSVWRTRTGCASRALAHHCQSLTGSQQPGVTPRNRRLAPMIQFVIKSTDLQLSLKGGTLPGGTARILLPADPHFTPPCLAFQNKAEVKGREIWCWLTPEELLDPVNPAKTWWLRWHSTFQMALTGHRWKTVVWENTDSEERAGCSKSLSFGMH